MNQGLKQFDSNLDFSRSSTSASQWDSDAGAPQSAQTLLGWNLSYRKQKPEIPDKPKILQRLKKKRVEFSDALALLPKSQRSLPSKKAAMRFMDRFLQRRATRKARRAVPKHK